MLKSFIFFELEILLGDYCETFDKVRNKYFIETHRMRLVFKVYLEFHPALFSGTGVAVTFTVQLQYNQSWPYLHLLAVVQRLKVINGLNDPLDY